jgi:hypothetical protein
VGQLKEIIQNSIKGHEIQEGITSDSSKQQLPSNINSQKLENESLIVASLFFLH